MHAAPTLAKSQLISSYSSKTYLAKLAWATSQNDLQFIFTADGRRICPFNLPLSAPACYWVPFRLSKHRLSNNLSKHQSNSQAKLSKPTRVDFKVSKRKRTRNVSEYIPIYQSSLQRDICIPNHLVTRSITKGKTSPPGKTFSSPENMSWKYCTHNHCFRTCYRCKIWAFLRKFFAPSGVQSWLGFAGDCCLVTSVSYATQLSLFAIKFFNFYIKFEYAKLMSKVLF